MSVRDWGALSRAERDAAYNNAAAVATRDELVRLRDEQGVAYRAAYPAHLDLPYGELERNKWDLYPAAEAGAPCMIFIHGGYWQMNRRENFAGVAAGVAAHGWSVAIPGYTLAPQAGLSQIVAELRTALDWLSGNGAHHGIAGKYYLTGWSAGGHLTALLLDHDLVSSGLAISGIFELGPLRDTYINENLKLTDDEIVRLSPQRLPAISKPLAIAYGAAELPEMTQTSRDFHAHRAASHAEGALIPIPHANHFDILEELRSPGGALTRWLVDYVGT